MKGAFWGYIVSLLIFGTNGIVAQQIALSSYHIVLLRTLIGSAFLALLYVAGRQSFHICTYKKDTAMIALSGVAMGASWMFLYEAYAQTGVSIATLLYNCGPVFVMMLSPLVFKERLTVRKLIGFAAVLCGMFCINGLTSGAVKPWGLMCGLLSALTYAVMVMANKKATHINGMENSLIQLVAGFVTVAVFVGCKTGFALPIQSEDWGWIVLLGVVNTAVGCYLYFSSIGKLPVQTVAVCGYLESVSAVIFAFVLLGETLSLLQYIGAVLIISGAVFCEYVRKPKSVKPQKFCKKTVV